MLIDEYDAPIRDEVHLSKNLEGLRYLMRRFYPHLKVLDPYIRFVFLTGITKFSPMSDFSGLNNLNNISMDKDYAAICGITESEMRTQLMPGVECMAREKGWTVEQTLEKLKVMYGGYHFAWPSEELYNSWCLTNALADRDTGDYFFSWGIPPLISELVKKYDMPVTAFHRACYEYLFNEPFERMDNPYALLYQSGYITIKGYEKASGRYLLDIPNKEVRLGLMSSLIKYYVPAGPWDENEYVLQNLGDLIQQGDINGALRLLQQFLLTIPYTANATSEGHFQQVLYVIFSLLGYYVDVEVHTPKGRVDMILRTHAHLYVIELKMDRDAATAMTQIEEKNYFSRFALTGLPVTKVAVNFDSRQRTISDWQIK